MSALCNNATLYEEKQESKRKKGKDGKEGVVSVWNIKGDPTEGALVVLSAKSGITQDSLREKYKRIAEFPFDSERKRMSVLVTSEHGRMACTKGAPDVLLAALQLHSVGW